MEERFLVTGATGCIGAWTVKNLVREGVFTSVLVRGGSIHRLRLIMEDDEIKRVRFVTGDITDIAMIRDALVEHGITHIIHLAAMQLPFCKADPPLGAAVNVGGTVNIFEAAKTCGIRHVVYASSTAVYGPRQEYPPGRWRMTPFSGPARTTASLSRPTKGRRASTGWRTASRASASGPTSSTAPAGTRGSPPRLPRRCLRRRPRTVSHHVRGTLRLPVRRRCGRGLHQCFSGEL